VHSTSATGAPAVALHAQQAPLQKASQVQASQDEPHDPPFLHWPSCSL